MARDAKPPLYRRVNTRTHGVRHGGGDYRHERSRSRDVDAPVRGSMHAGQRLGRDYTPLYRFLASKVGEPWDAVFSEAKSRLDTVEPIRPVVARDAEAGRALVRTGESSYVGGLYVDADGRLQRVDATLDAATLRPSCACCTHTFEGVPFGLGFDEERR